MVKKFTTYDEIENLCEAMVKDFMKRKHYTNAHCVDIEGLVREYLGFPIVYETFAEPDPGRIGFVSDGSRPLWVGRDGVKLQALFPKDTIVIERYLLNPKEAARRRFTIAHEAAHIVLSRHVPNQLNVTAAFHSEFDGEMRYDQDMLREMMNVNEMFSNRAGACLLMPQFLVARVMKRNNPVGKFYFYDNFVVSQEQKLLIQKIADVMGVSYTAFFNRIKELNLFEMRPIETYLHDTLGFGGGVYD